MPILMTAFFACALAATAYFVWFDCTHHCVAAHVERVPESCSQIWIDGEYYGDSCSPEHDETVCDAYERNR
jgi:hypothetical protein